MSDKRARQRRTRRLQIKFRLIPLRRMRRSELLDLFSEAVDTGVVPEGLEILQMDWGLVRGSRWTPRTVLTPPDREELQKAAAILRAGTLRFEEPR